jgi:hypothetical protein
MLRKKVTKMEEGKRAMVNPDYTAEWNQIHRQFNELMEYLKEFPDSREVAITRTKVQEALLWWHVERGFRPEKLPEEE